MAPKKKNVNQEKNIYPMNDTPVSYSNSIPIPDPYQHTPPSYPIPEPSHIPYLYPILIEPTPHKHEQIIIEDYKIEFRDEEVKTNCRACHHEVR